MLYFASENLPASRSPEALLRLLEGAGFRAEVRRLGRLGLLLAEVG